MITYSKEDQERIKALKQQIAYNAQNQFVAGGDNEDLRKRCDALRARINEIERKYERESAA